MVGVGRGRVCTEPLPVPRDTPGFTISPLNGCQFSSNQMVAPHGCGYVPSLWLPPRTMPGQVRVACTSPDVQTASGLGTRRPGSAPACPPPPPQVLLLPGLCFLSCRVGACHPPASSVTVQKIFTRAAGQSAGQGRLCPGGVCSLSPGSPHPNPQLCAGHRTPRRGRPGGGRAAPPGQGGGPC